MRPCLGTVGDPFEFWRRYQEAATRSEGEVPLLSERAMGPLERIAAGYEMVPE